MINPTMKFRQRIAWLMVLAYLGGTFAFFYYMFEINEHYNQYAVDHVHKYHSSNADKPESQTIFATFWCHLADIPLTVWMLVGLLPYLQLFMMILACTRAEPKHSIAYLWPGLVYLKYQQLLRKRTDLIIPSKQASVLTLELNGTSNGHTVIHT